MDDTLRLRGDAPYIQLTRASQPLYWEAAILGVAFVALVLGAIGVLITICHAYFRSRNEKQKEDRARRAVQLYDSVTIMPSNDTKEKLISKNSNVAIISSKDSGVHMPGELGGTMTKAMSYDVNP